MCCVVKCLLLMVYMPVFSRREEGKDAHLEKRAEVERLQVGFPLILLLDDYSYP